MLAFVLPLVFFSFFRPASTEGWKHSGVVLGMERLFPLNTPVPLQAAPGEMKWSRAMIPECSLLFNFRGTCSGPVNQPESWAVFGSREAVNKHRAEQLRGPRDFDFAEMQICGMGILKC